MSKLISMLRSFVFHAPAVKSGTLIGFELFLTDQSVNGTIELHAAASYCEVKEMLHRAAA